jgi:hypothetical protein
MVITVRQGEAQQAVNATVIPRIGERVILGGQTMTVVMVEHDLDADDVIIEITEREGHADRGWGGTGAGG